MTRRATDPQPGIVAQWSAECPKCGEFIQRGLDRVYFSRGRACHVGCAPGGDDT